MNAKDARKVVSVDGVVSIRRDGVQNDAFSHPNVVLCLKDSMIKKRGLPGIPHNLDCLCCNLWVRLTLDHFNNRFVNSSKRTVTGIVAAALTCC